MLAGKDLKVLINIVWYLVLSMPTSGKKRLFRVQSTLSLTASVSCSGERLALRGSWRGGPPRLGAALGVLGGFLWRPGGSETHTYSSGVFTFHLS